MYKHGKPIYRFSRRPLVLIAGLIILALAVGYYVVIARSAKNTLKNNDKPLVSTVKVANVNTPVSEPDFEFTLPGKWQLDAYNWDARYHAWEWKMMDSHFAGRTFRVFLDTIPADDAYNYLLPISANGNGIITGQMSGNCADFTTTNGLHKNSQGTFAAQAKWAQVTFWCDYGNQGLQVVGTSSVGAINSITLTGPKAGTHKYFFLYIDNDFNPDLGVIGNILSTFHAK